MQRQRIAFAGIPLFYPASICVIQCNCDGIRLVFDAVVVTDAGDIGCDVISDIFMPIPEGKNGRECGKDATSYAYLSHGGISDKVLLTEMTGIMS